MICKPLNRFGKVVIHAVDAVLVFGSFCAETSVCEGYFADFLAVIGVVGDYFGDDIHCAGNGVPCRFHALFHVDVVKRKTFGRAGGLLLCKN